MTPDEEWEALVAAIVEETAAGPAPAVRFVATGLQVNRKMFANFAHQQSLAAQVVCAAFFCRRIFCRRIFCKAI